jgi:hypothetical protein
MNATDYTVQSGATVYELRIYRFQHWHGCNWSWHFQGAIYCDGKYLCEPDPTPTTIYRRKADVRRDGIAKIDSIVRGA